jgi:hypothetical protein
MRTDTLPAMGARIVLSDAEWLLSESSFDELAELMRAGDLLPAQRTGKRILVNPAHVVALEDWPAAPRVSSETD